MTVKQTTKTICNPFRYLSLWDLEKLLKQVGEMEVETRALVLEAITEKKSSIAQEENNFLIGRRHTDFLKHSL